MVIIRWKSLNSDLNSGLHFHKPHWLIHIKLKMAWFGVLQSSYYIQNIYFYNLIIILSLDKLHKINAICQLSHFFIHLDVSSPKLLSEWNCVLGVWTKSFTWNNFGEHWSPASCEAQSDSINFLDNSSLCKKLLQDIKHYNLIRQWSSYIHFIVIALKEHNTGQSNITFLQIFM
jgi:hypothetical protein